MCVKSSRRRHKQQNKSRRNTPSGEKFCNRGEICNSVGVPGCVKWSVEQRSTIRESTRRGMHLTTLVGCASRICFVARRSLLLRASYYATEIGIASLLRTARRRGADHLLFTSTHTIDSRSRRERSKENTFWSGPTDRKARRYACV